MKKSYIFKAGALAGAFIALTACTEETFDTVNKAGIPNASDYNIVVTVDQETNQFKLNIDNPIGVYPVWKIYTKENPVIATRDGYSDIIVPAGDYEVEMQVGNRHGISEGVRTATIHIENTKIDFAPYIRNLTDNASKEWHIAGDQQNHLGCGPSGTDGLEWWQAGPGAKEAEGVYANKMIFKDAQKTQGGLYTYDPGASGTIYVNTGITDLPPYSDYNPKKTDPESSLDYCAPAEIQADRDFELVAEGADLMLVLPKGTLFGYIPNMEIYNEPKFKVYSITRNKIELSCDNGAIAWHYILAPFESAPVDVTTTGFKYDSEFNLYKDIDEVTPSFWYAPGWAQIADPTLEREGNKAFKFSLPEATSDQWQGQFNFKTGIKTSADKNYDVSVIVKTSKDHPGVTFKLTTEVMKEDGSGTEDKGEIILTREAVAAGDDHVIWIHDAPGIDSDDLKVVFDFGGNEAGTDVEIKNIVIKESSNDDGTVIPVEPEGPAHPDFVDYASELNLYSSIAEVTPSYYYAPGWAQIADPTLEREGNKVFKFSLPEATSDQWQAQFNFKSGIQTSAEKLYDVRVVVLTSKDHPGVTFKLTTEVMKEDGSGTEDKGEITLQRVSTYGGEELEIWAAAAPGIDSEDLKIVFDFGGNEAGTDVVIKDIIIQEHKD
jgi:hypothetical protein